MKRLAFLALAFIFSGWTAFSEERLSLNDVAIYDYQGLEKLNGDLWMAFDIFKDDKTVERIHVLPENFGIELRNDQKDITTLKAVISKSSWDRHFASSIKLLAPSVGDFKSWNDYREKLRRELRAEGNLQSIKFEYVNGKGGLITVGAKIKNTEYGKDNLGWDEYVTQIRVSIDNVSIAVKGNLKDKTTFLVEWGLGRTARDDTQKFSYLSAPNMVIYVQDDNQLRIWNEHLAVWKNKLKPHRILPPKD